MVTGPDRPILRFLAAPVSVWVLVALCVGIEGVLQASDRNLFGSGVLRFWAYELGGFKPALLSIESPRFPGQTVSMFLTYAVLHGGILHLLINMITLLSLGTTVTRYVGVLRFYEIFLGSAIAGAILYAFFPGSGIVMVGASGGLFGLAGALLVWEIGARFDRTMPLAPVIASIALLVVLNLVLWVMLDGRLAWQGHLGGFLAGAALAAADARRDPSKP